MEPEITGGDLKEKQVIFKFWYLVLEYFDSWRHKQGF